MCGIVGYVGRRDAVPVLLEGLARLEYRGYDSAGLAVVKGDALKVHKREGRVRDLADALPKRLSGELGIAHTRWATHGPPSDANAHPHTDATGQVAVVHNGIIENADDLRARLQEHGVELQSDTDTELVAHLIGRSAAEALEDRVRDALRQVRGAYGLAVIDVREPQRMVVARNGSPVVLGIGDREMLVASDVSALVKHVQQVVHLDDGEIAVLDAKGFTTSTLDRQPVDKEPFEVDGDVEAYEKGGYDTYLRKEISEQPDALRGTLRGRVDRRFATAHLGGIEATPRELSSIRRVKLLGCGSAYYAGMVGAELIESLARIPADAESASEFRYRNPVVDPEALYVAVSQSGETADTLAAVQELKRKGARVLGVVNVVGSSIARACGNGIYLHAGPEVSVASTKAFASMCVAFGLLALHLGRMRDLPPQDGEALVDALEALPGHVADALGREDEALAAAELVIQARSAFYVGRVRGWPVALEGAQKLKEISYVHAEAYPAGELKHGPLALVTPELPTVVIAPDDHLLDKNLSTMQQVRARGGPVVSVGHRRFDDLADVALTVPKSFPALDPILLGVPLQLLAYHAARLLERDIDQPRNLAKSVTVE
jgi:glutamine---fructose-6-phosphate transaminase (isomerizing)